MENIGVGLMLMVVGMATVFVILLIVIYLSKYLITVVNKSGPRRDPQKSTCCSTYGRYWCYGCY